MQFSYWIILEEALESDPENQVFCFDNCMQHIIPSFDAFSRLSFFLYLFSKYFYLKIFIQIFFEFIGRALHSDGGCWDGRIDCFACRGRSISPCWCWLQNSRCHCLGRKGLHQDIRCLRCLFLTFQLFISMLLPPLDLSSSLRFFLYLFAKYFKLNIFIFLYRSCNFRAKSNCRKNPRGGHQWYHSRRRCSFFCLSFEPTLSYRASDQTTNAFNWKARLAWFIFARISWH